MRFGSVCSGIEAASVAWGPLGWKAAWLAEIEPFPSAVLAHHYPDVPNLGDMSKLPGRILSGEIEAPDVFCGGTPCQAFSVAGLRRSLDDARGNLSLVFCEIADAIDSVRHARGEQPAIIFWENVPGVLSTSDNAFGCFLAGLAGEDDPLEPPGGKWTNAGYVLGPQRAVAWRVLDAQYFGVAQRRRRVFVVASARKGFDPAAVLFEFDGVRRDSAPSREAGEGTAVGAARSVALRGREGGGTIELGDDVGGCLRASSGGGDKPHVLAAQCVTGDITHTLKAEGFDASEDGTGRGQPIVTVHAAVCSGSDPILTDGEVMFPLTTRHGDQTAIAFSCKDYGADVGELSPTLRSMGHDGSHANAGGQVAVAFRVHGEHSTATTGNGTARVADPVEAARSLDTCGGYATNQGGNVVLQPAVAFAQNSRDEVRLMNGDGQIVGALAAEPGMKQTWYVEQSAMTFQERGRDDGRSLEIGGDVAYALTAPNGGGRAQERNVLTPTMQVRRLTPRECERLQGFPDDYTLIPWRKKPAEDCPDGPRYKALGNSWAVPNVRWIGRRIWDEVYFPRGQQ